MAEVLTREMDVPSGDAKKITETFLRRFRRCPENPRIPLDEWRLNLWAQALGEEFEELAEDIYPRWKKLRYKNLTLSEVNLAMLRGLHKEYQLALVTNGPSNSQWEKIKELRIGDHFDAIVVSGDLKWEKPQAEIFHRACQLLGVEPFECLIVGDKIETDIEGGFQAGLGITVWVRQGPESEGPKPNPQPDFTITDVSQLVQILQSGKDKAKAGKKTKNKKASPADGGDEEDDVTASTSAGGAAAVVSGSSPPGKVAPTASTSSSAVAAAGTVVTVTVAAAAGTTAVGVAAGAVTGAGTVTGQAGTPPGVSGQSGSVTEEE